MSRIHDVRLAILVLWVFATVPASQFAVAGTGAPAAAMTKAAMNSDHDLAGRIWDVHAGRFINEEQLFDGLAGAEYILLGETHDNVMHHDNQIRVIKNLAERGLHASVVFEMIDDEQGKVLQQHKYDSSADLIKLLARFKTGWDYSLYYRKLFDAAIRAGYPIVPGNISRDRLLAVIMQDQGDPGGAIDAMLARTPLTEGQQSAMKAEIIESHCNMLNDDMAISMVSGQRMRDASMALSLINDRSEHKILIAGSGHVRDDYGVPLYLRVHDSHAKIAALGFQEVEDDVNDIHDYAEAWGTAALPFDYVWMTARTQREDPCAGFKDHFRHKMK